MKVVSSKDSKYRILNKKILFILKVGIYFKEYTKVFLNHWLRNKVRFAANQWSINVLVSLIK